MTFLGKYDVQDAPGTPVVHEKDTLQTQEAVSSSTRLTTSSATTSAAAKPASDAVAVSAGNQGRVAGALADVERVPGRVVRSFNLFATYTLNRRSIAHGIDNLNDVQPNIVGVVRATTMRRSRADYYDILGRRAYIGVRRLSSSKRYSYYGGPRARRFFPVPSRTGCERSLGGGPGCAGDALGAHIEHSPVADELRDDPFLAARRRSARVNHPQIGRAARQRVHEQ